MSKDLFLSKTTLYLLSVFIGLRLASFFLVDYLVIQGIAVFCLLICLVVLFYKKPVYGWFFLVTELLLGGTGNLLSLGGLSIRTVFLLAFLLMYYSQGSVLHGLQKQIKKLSPLSHIIFFLLIYVWFSAILGLIYGHGMQAVISDTIPYLFFLLILPAIDFLREKDNYDYYLKLLIAFVIGSALFSLLTFVLFSSGFVELQEPYYKWVRDIVGGKITDLGSGFWRVVMPIHLFLTPMMIIVSSTLIGDKWNTDETDLTDLNGFFHLKFIKPLRNIFFDRKNNALYLWLVLLITVPTFVFNFSRTYILGLIIGLLVLGFFYRSRIWHWFTVSFLLLFSIFAFFSITHFVSSGFTSPGWDLFGIRIASVVRPNSEVSSATRSQLLPPILNMIKERPLIGSGLGSSVTFVNPVSNKEVVTRQFDWGYLEMFAELGFIGLAIFTILLLFVFYGLLRSANYGYTAVFVSLLAMNVTTPVLFHVFGVILVVYLVVYSDKKAIS